MGSGRRYGDDTPEYIDIHYLMPPDEIVAVLVQLTRGVPQSVLRAQLEESGYSPEEARKAVNQCAGEWRRTKRNQSLLAIVCGCLTVAIAFGLAVGGPFVGLDIGNYMIFPMLAGVVAVVWGVVRLIFTLARIDQPFIRFSTWNNARKERNRIRRERYRAAKL